MEWEKVVGIAASAFSALALLPQLIKILKEKLASDMSWMMVAGLFGSIILWGVYGLLKSDWIIVVSNSISFVINSLITIINYRYQKAGMSR